MGNTQERRTTMIDPQECKKMGFRNAVGTKWILPRKNPKLEAWADKNMVRMPNQLCWMEKAEEEIVEEAIEDRSSIECEEE